MLARACYSNLFVLVSFMFFESLLSSIHPSILLPPALSPPVDFGAGRGPSKSRVGASERARKGRIHMGRETRSFFTFLALGPVARRQPTDHSRRDVFHKEFREMHRLPVYARVRACTYVIHPIFERARLFLVAFDLLAAANDPFGD